MHNYGVLQLQTKIGNTGTKVVVQFTLTDERDIDWETLKVHLYDHPEVDITDLIGDEWSLEISEDIYANADRLVQEANDDAEVESYITNQMFKE
jgi:uncharacterized metal-binding protein YceD (DUF177 family)